MARKRVSSTTIALAESRRKESTDSLADAEPKHSGKKLIILLISLLLILGGIVAGYYLYSKSPLAPAPKIPSTQNNSSVIPSDTVINIILKDDFDYQELRLLTQKEILKPHQLGSIVEIVLLLKDTRGNTTRLTGPYIAKQIDIGAPDILLRSLTAPWMLGIYTNPTGHSSSFVVVTTNFFQNAFAGMLQWERIMADDIKDYLFPIPPRGIASVNLSATSSATSTSQGTTTDQVHEPLKPYTTVQGRFEDRIILNKDVRSFRTLNGEILFLYSFLDNTKLVIAGNEEALAEIIKRLEKRAFVR